MCINRRTTFVADKLTPLIAQPTASSAAALKVYCQSLQRNPTYPRVGPDVPEYYSDCICGEFIVSLPYSEDLFMLRLLMDSQLVIDKSLATLPRRKTDGAIIIRSKDSEDGKARVFKLNANAGEPVLLERFAFSTPFNVMY